VGRRWNGWRWLWDRFITGVRFPSFPGSRRNGLVAYGDLRGLLLGQSQDEGRDCVRFRKLENEYVEDRYCGTSCFVAVLSSPKEFANRPAYYADYTVSIGQLLAIVEETYALEK